MTGDAGAFLDIIKRSPRGSDWSIEEQAYETGAEAQRKLED